MKKPLIIGEQHYRIPDEATRGRSAGFTAIKGTQRLRDIAQSGGQAAHFYGTAHRFTHEEAVAAGRKGAAKRKANRDAARLAQKHTEDS